MSVIKAVQLDALVVMKIVKHCAESPLESVTGQLLGLDRDSTLQITHSFPFPNTDEEDEEAGVEYQFEMMRCLREVNVDSNTVGWYQSTFLGSYLTEAMVDTQYQYQSNIKESVVIIYDPVKTTQGVVSLHALRLTDAFMKVYKGGSFTKQSLQDRNISFSNIFEEVPIHIHNSILGNVLLQQMQGTDALDTSSQVLNLNSDAFIEKYAELLVESVDELAVEQGKLAKHTQHVSRQQQQIETWLARRRNENVSRAARGLAPLPATNAAAAAAVGAKSLTEPSRLESLLLTKQLSDYCDQLSQHSGEAFAKRFLVASLRKQADEAAN